MLRTRNLFVNELSKSEISTFAKLRINPHDLHTEKGRHTKTILSERKCVLCDMAIEDEKQNVMECASLSTCRQPFFDALDQIIPSFASKTVDEKCAFIIECTDYDIACTCVTFRVRDRLISNINASHWTNASNADSSWYSRYWHCFDVDPKNLTDFYHHHGFYFSRI